MFLAGRTGQSAMAPGSISPPGAVAHLPRWTGVDKRKKEMPANWTFFIASLDRSEQPRT